MPKNTGAEAPKKGSGKRRRFRGRMVMPNGSPRAHHIDKKMAPISWECGSTAEKAAPTQHLKGIYKVSPPTKSVHRSRFGNVTPKEA